MYGYTLDYVLDCMTLKQVFYFAKEGLRYNGNEVDDTPDLEGFRRTFGGRKVVSK